jgi:hypothetical protein
MLHPSIFCRNLLLIFRGVSQHSLQAGQTKGLTCIPMHLHAPALTPSLINSLRSRFPRTGSSQSHMSAPPEWASVIVRSGRRLLYTIDSLMHAFAASAGGQKRRGADSACKFSRRRQTEMPRNEMQMDSPCHNDSEVKREANSYFNVL